MILSSPVYEDVRQRGMDRIIGALKNHTIPEVALTGKDSDYLCLKEVLSYLYARIIVSCVNESQLTKRYALAEAENMNRLLQVEKSSIDTVVEELEITTIRADDGFKLMHFSDFLKYSHFMNATEWKLINMDVRKGYVRLTDEKFIRLLQNAYRLRIESELPREVTPEIRKLVEADTARAKAELDDYRARISPTNGEAVNDSYFPPCISNIISMARRGQNLPHSARFALVTFLHALGVDYQGIIAVFAVSPDFDESKSEYQIKHITGELSGGEGYTAPGCKNIKSTGLCCCGDNPLCAKINHPLNYYRVKAGIRFEPRDEDGKV